MCPVCISALTWIAAGVTSTGGGVALVASRLRSDQPTKEDYSTYARGLDGLWGMYQWPDRAPKGRNETGIWRRRHDEYDKC